MKQKHDLGVLKALLKRNENREKKLKLYIQENKETKKKIKNPETGEEKEITVTPIHYKKRLRRVRRRIKRLNTVIQKLESPVPKTSRKKTKKAE